MSLKTVQVEIVGVTPLLIHRFNEDAEQSKATRRIEVKDRNPRDEAKKVAYIAPDGSFYFNGVSIPRCMANAGANHKMRGSRKSLRHIVPSAVRITTDAVTIRNGNGIAKDFEVDSRPVTIPATKGRVMRHRPRFDNWSAKFELQVNDDLLDTEQAQKLLEEAGQVIGIGDYRPERSGPFGTFRVTEWKERSGKAR